MLAVSGIGLLVAWAGLVPTKISALGIEFNQTEQRNLKISLAVVIAYFAVAFALYAWADFLAWRLRQIRTIEDFANATADKESKFFGPSGAYEQVRDMKKRELSGETLFQFPQLVKLSRALTKPTTVVRALFEFVFPVALAIFAGFSLLSLSRP